MLFYTTFVFVGLLIYPCYDALNWNYRVAPKISTIFLYALTLLNINRFSKLFHCQNQQKICNNTVAKDTITPQVCRWWNVSVIKATIENKTTSVTTHFNKLTTGNNAFIVSNEHIVLIFVMALCMHVLWCAIGHPVTSALQMSYYYYYYSVIV